MAPKTFVTSIGFVNVERRYYAGRECDCKAVPWDDWAGLDPKHKLTLHARRLVTLAGSETSFDKASAHLLEFCGLEVSNDVVRRVCNEEGEQAGTWLKESEEPAKQMAQATGEVELYTDGVQVNTVGGWRETRVSVVAKREPAKPAAPEEWDKRVLEEPTCRVARAAIAASYKIGASWDQMIKQLGLENTPRISVLADGARWIWDEVAKRFKMITDVDCVVDIYHVSEHIHACGKRMFGVNDAAKTWSNREVEELLRLEGPKFIQRIQEQRDKATDQAAQDALSSLLNYLTANAESLWYRTRLAEGLPIGSGLVEGTCKNMIGQRLKKNSPRWRIKRAENMAALRCLHYSDLWKAYWKSRAEPVKLAA